MKYIPDCNAVLCENNDISLYEMRYIFMHKINEIYTSNENFDKFLNDLLKSDKLINEKVRELQNYVP